MLRPEIGIRLILEADRQNFVTKGGANWIAMGTFKWNLFDGGQARQMRAEAGHLPPPPPKKPAPPPVP